VIGRDSVHRAADRVKRVLLDDHASETRTDCQQKRAEAQLSNLKVDSSVFITRSCRAAPRCAHGSRASRTKTKAHLSPPRVAPLGGVARPPSLLAAGTTPTVRPVL
jgi:hypothetical protein